MGVVFAGVPEGGGQYILSRVIDSFDDARAVAVLANCRRAMGERGRLLLVEPVLPDRVEGLATPTIPADMLMDLNMLVRPGRRERTGEYRRSWPPRTYGWHGSSRRKDQYLLEAMPAQASAGALPRLLCGPAPGFENRP